MKQNLLFGVLSALLFSGNIYSQSLKDSFEISEGFTIGALNGQKSWENWGFVNNEHSNILVSELATDGVNIVEVKANADEEENWGGILYPLPNYEKISVSADVYLDGISGSDYDMLSLYYLNGSDYEYVAGFYFDYYGGLEVGSEDSIVSLDNWTSNKWYNLKTTVDFKNRIVDMYLDNVKVHSFALPQEVTELYEVDFEFDNYETGFKVDNFKVVNLDNLSVDNFDKQTIKVYPNPTADIINIEGVKDIQTITITDMMGRNVLVAKQGPLNVENLKSGMYIVTVKTANKTYTQKLIKK